MDHNGFERQTQRLPTIIKIQLEIKKKFLNSWFPSLLRQVAKHHASIEYMWISGRNLEGLQSG